MGWLTRVNKWVNKNSLNALNNAYHNASVIKDKEDKYFEGKKITADSDLGKSVFDYFQTTLEGNLIQIRLSLSQFHISNFFNSTDSANQEAEVLEKLKFIESVIGKYRHNSETLSIPLQVQTQDLTKPNQLRNVTSPKVSNISSPSGIFDFKRELTPDYEQ